ncbi:unnamed protein product (macronuclear) [Paramecium tetraurelia]|uniref:Uncharacterized protein n=1 Tax=Paramecium tetraurelia TaxID=5888 RepID=A0CA00_PARTE|nr:uncharacterized protein GSPATT00036396001 [Paramecium tetraurelia]CAK67617.1 unnamed protein product [Paramecium tetraurelia]|eukprot:XP_001435014.1 hypothetical protein (macronuclear) [Paramecium tetraurelia strain d4-2]
MDKIQREVQTFQYDDQNAEMATEEFINLSLSDHFEEYQFGLQKFKIYLNLNYPDLEEPIAQIIKKQLIPKMLFHLENSFNRNQVDKHLRNIILKILSQKMAQCKFQFG